RLDQPIKLAAFEGPLDLLLYLIRKNEIDIYDIPIGEITRQYLEILYAAEKLRLEVAGDFFVMAATLMQIKSRMLLPVDQQRPEESEEDGPDPRWELVQQLLEYERFKKAAEELQSLMEQQQDRLPRLYKEPCEEPQKRPIKPIDKMDIWTAFNQVLRRLSERMVVGSIEDESVTVSDRMERILEILKTRRSFTFLEILQDEKITFNLVVATFLAMLELTRTGKLMLLQSQSFGDIDCIARDDISPTEGEDDDRTEEDDDAGSEY